MAAATAGAGASTGGGGASAGTGAATGNGSAGASGSASFGTPGTSGNASGSTSSGANNRVNPGPPQNRLIGPATNGFAPSNTTDTNQPPDSSVNVTNQFFNTNQVFVTNQFSSTNFVSMTNRTGLGSNDQAATEFDRALVLQVRQRVYRKDPGISASWNAVAFAANGGNILVSGQVAQLADKQNLLVLVQNTPGVVSVVDHVLVTPGIGATDGSTGTVSRFLSPAPDPSLGDSYRFSSPSNRFGQRVIVPPARGTTIATNLSPTGPTNPGSTNVILEGSAGTNVIVVPVDTNGTSP